MNPPEIMPDPKETIQDFLINSKYVADDNISNITLSTNPDFPAHFQFTAWLKTSIRSYYSTPIVGYQGYYDIATGEVKTYFQLEASFKILKLLTQVDFLLKKEKSTFVFDQS